MNYKRIYESLIERAKNRVPPEGYIERHHVVPRCLGGSDDDSNLVSLTPEEHYVAHQLLVKMYPTERGLIYAANKMCVGHKGRRKNKRYGWLKRKYSKQRAIDSRGKGNTQHGTMWINKIGTNVNKKIQKGELIPEGWQKGRKLKPSEVCGVCGKEIKKGSSFCRLHLNEEIAKNNERKARVWYEKLLKSGSSITDFVKSCDYPYSKVAFINMLKTYIPEFNPKPGTPFQKKDT